MKSIFNMKFLPFILLALIFSCSKKEYVNVRFRYIGNDRIFVIDQKFGARSVAVGILTNGGTASTLIRLDKRRDIPANVKIKYRKCDNLIEEINVDLAKIMIRKSSSDWDNLIFNIYPNNSVVVSFEKCVDEYNSVEFDDTGKVFVP